MKLILLSGLLALSGCASVANDNGMLLVETVSNGQPVSGANCVVSNAGSNWTITTPANVRIGVSNGDLRVVCDKPGYLTSELIVRANGAASGAGVSVGAGGGSGGVGFGLGFGLPIGGQPAAYPARVQIELRAQ